MTLAADLYRPATAQPSPTLVTVLPYRRDLTGGVAQDGPARWFAARGYASLLVDLQGTGSSDGLRRPEFDAGEADDALAAIDWARAQPWCSGQIGLWGTSYSAVVTMRAAATRPAGLRAIMPLLHGLNPGRDTIHPDGARGDLHALVNRGTTMLVQQLLPPLPTPTYAADLARWRHRVLATPPTFADVARHGPRDPVWQQRAVPGESITVPAFCVGGWLDAFPDALIDAYERMTGPKKLLVGPWGHVLPHSALREPVDVLALALRWWNHWLRGTDDGLMNEPPVTLYIGGDRPGWRALDSWPPRATITVLHAGTQLTYSPDPTVGTTRGLPGLCLGERCPPTDQRPDDRRSLCLDFDPLAEDLLLGGRPRVTVGLLDSAPSPERLVARLADVSPDGTSTLICLGVLVPLHPSGEQHILLRPAAYRIAAGHRIRLALADADFPRLNPLPDPTPFAVSGVRLELPTLAEDPLPAAPPRAQSNTTDPGAITWAVTRDDDAVAVAYRSMTSGTTTTVGHRFETATECRATVRRTDPAAAVCQGAHAVRVYLGPTHSVTATATVHCARTYLHAHAVLMLDGQVILSRSWEDPLGEQEHP